MLGIAEYGQLKMVKQFGGVIYNLDRIDKKFKNDNATVRTEMDALAATLP